MSEPSRTLVGVCAALLDSEGGGPDPDWLADRLTAQLARMPRAPRGAFRGAALALDGLALTLSGRRLADLDGAGRERVLGQLARRRSLAPLLESLKTLVLLVAGAEQATAELRERAEATPLARPDADLSVTPAQRWPSRTSADVVVIGSGAGGAMAARTLARAGLETVVIEEGRRFGVEEFRTGPPLERFSDLYRDAGSSIAFGRPPILLPTGRGVGGTTLVNSGTCYRTPERVLRRWRDEAGFELADPETFAPYLDEVEATLGVAPVDRSVMGNNGRLALAGAEALGWDSAPLLRNAPGCVGSCQCAIGCPRNAKSGVHLNALPQACAAGAEIVSEARVERIDHEEGRAVGVLARRRDHSTIEIRAPRVVIAAGAIETPLLARRSGLGTHPQLGHNLAVHPAVSVSGRFEEPVVAWRGVMQSVGVEEFHESDGILMEASSTPPGMGSALLPGYGRGLRIELADADHLASIGALIADSPAGRVHGRRRPLVEYRMTRPDGRRLVRAIGILGRVLFAAGATEVLTGIPGNERVGHVDELAAALRGADHRHLHVAAFHPTGTARAGADPERSPVDGDGKLRGIEGVWVVDASAIPGSPSVNPQVSIMALSLAIADRIVAA